MDGQHIQYIALVKDEAGKQHNEGLWHELLSEGRVTQGLSSRKSSFIKGHS